MSINFIPNDPMAGTDAAPVRRQKPAANRPPGRAGFALHDPAREGLYAPGTPEQLFWQCREAALATVAAWERHAGPLAEWAQKRRRLHLYQNVVRQLHATPELNAFYDRAAFQFFEFDDGSKTTMSGASTDVVAHEIGHGLLDTIRPDLWDTPFLEVNAFHEAFGDCMALVTALADSRTRTALLAVGMGKGNFVEATAEDLADSVRRVDPRHNAAAPRRALNTFRWQLPASLPSDGGPGQLINESHSFAQVFTGCFWDLIRNLLGRATTSLALKGAVRAAAKLLVRGAGTAPEGARFFQAVGRAMVLADDTLHDGANHVAIRDAFAAHGIALGSSAMLAPVAALVGPPPRVRRGTVSLSGATRRDLAGRFGVAGVRVVLRGREIAGTRVVHAVHSREIRLDQLSPKLRGVMVMAPESVLVGASGTRAAVLGALPEAKATIDEVMTYVGSLVKHERIDFGEERSLGWRHHARPGWHSHAVRSIRGKQVLVRVRFACGCGRTDLAASDVP